MVKLRALRPLCGDYSQRHRNGYVPEGSVFETDEAHAVQLEAQGTVERVHEPLGTRVHKMIFGSPENKAAAGPVVVAPDRMPGPPQVDTRRRR